MRTIFISLFQAIEFRNIVRTDIYQELVRRQDIRLVFLTDSQAKKAYYEKEFSAPNIVYEVIGQYPAQPFAALFGFLKYNLIRTRTIDIKREYQLEGSGNYFQYYAKLIFNRIFARSFIRKIVRSIDYYIIDDHFFARYFEAYNPSVVLMAHLFSDIEISLLREAKHWGVRSIGLINSWDKLTARRMLRLLPDEMIVHNDLIKQDAIRFADMKPEHIHVTGIPHFDFYTSHVPLQKEVFYRKYGLNQGDQILLFCPAGKTNYDNDMEMLMMLDSLWTAGRLPENLKMIIRLPPNDHVDIPEMLRKKYVVQVPGKRFAMERGTDWDMNANDFMSLADTLFHSSIVVSYSSTISIDAAVFDKPIINVAIDFGKGRKSSWIYEVDHYQPVLESGALTMVRDENELVEAVHTYLKNPRLHADGRARLVREQCGKIDGFAGKRVADILAKTKP